MEKNLQPLNDVIVGSADPAVAKLLALLKRDSRVKRLAPRLYTTNLTDSPETIVRRHLWMIIGKLWPGARLSYRTAFEYAPHEGNREKGLPKGHPFASLPCAVDPVVRDNRMVPPEISTATDRVRTPLQLDLTLLGTLKPRAAKEIASSNWRLGVSPERIWNSKKGGADRV